MTISKGSAWAIESAWPDDGPRFDTDHDLAAAAAQALSEGTNLEAVLEAGDLRRTLGGPRPSGATPYRYPCDLGFVRLDDTDEVPFVAHVICHRRFWQGEAVAIMNAAYADDRYLGPKSHPNDDLLDITFGSLPLQQRLMADKRSRQGTHVPHPGLKTRRVSAWEHEFARSTPVWVDGRRLGRCRRIQVRLVTDAFAVIA